jgi:hypothetical protein
VLAGRLTAHLHPTPGHPVAGIPWLIDKFKQYVVLRDRLFSDTSVLRGKLQEAIPGEPACRRLRAQPASATWLSIPCGAPCLRWLLSEVWLKRLPLLF